MRCFDPTPTNPGIASHRDWFAATLDKYSDELLSFSSLRTCPRQLADKCPKIYCKQPISFSNVPQCLQIVALSHYPPLINFRASNLQLQQAALPGRSHVFFTAGNLYILIVILLHSYLSHPMSAKRSITFLPFRPYFQTPPRPSANPPPPMPVLKTPSMPVVPGPPSQGGPCMGCMGQGRRAHNLRILPRVQPAQQVGSTVPASAFNTPQKKLRPLQPMHPCASRAHASIPWVLIAGIAALLAAQLVAPCAPCTQSVPSSNSSFPCLAC